MNNRTFQAIRAIGSEFAARLWRFSLFVTIGICVVLAPLFTWLISVSAWWWALAFPLIIALSVAVALLVIFFLLIRHVRPQLSDDQSKQVGNFVDKLQRVQELSGTPRFIILFRIIRSVAAPRSEPYLKELFETKDLHRDFVAITKTFAS